MRAAVDVRLGAVIVCHPCRARCVSEACRLFCGIADFLDAKVPQVKFVDRTFNCNHERTLALLHFLRTHDNGVTNFHFEVAADLLNEAELAEIAAMREGLVQLEIGVQSTNLQTIEAIDRTMNLEKLKKVVASVHSAGNVHQHLDLIAGLPYEIWSGLSSRLMMYTICSRTSYSLAF